MISLAAEPLFRLGPFVITNGVLGAFTITGTMTVLALLMRLNISLIPGRVQAGLEMLVNFVLELLERSFGSREAARTFFPFLMTVLLFIVVANQFSVVPFVSQLVAGEKPLLRLPTADLSQTLLLALFVIGLSHVLALRMSPLKHIGAFIKLKPFLNIRRVRDIPQALLDFFLGLLDIVGELAKVISLACRLFGNIFAGEVMVAVIAGLTTLTAFVVPIPFMVLSIFSGFIQAFVFLLLSTQFIAGTYKSYYVESPTSH
ncbi:F0F1 ATP synthase subunit A [Candidatus Uhrbacteria bacterium]|nr:F0F1 ATP synthase subunit A [Candidatus Uhrbacteria bacterium]